MICARVVRVCDERLSIRVASWVELLNQVRCELDCATCPLTCGVQVWSSETMVDNEGEGHMGLCRWIRSSEEWTLGLDQGTGEGGGAIMVADT